MPATDNEGRAIMLQGFCSVASGTTITVAETSRQLIAIIVDNSQAITLVVVNADGTGVELVENPGNFHWVPNV
jgi:uncharacterized circularly permuted ATP-grasp superfamily protein